MDSEEINPPQNMYAPPPPEYIQPGHVDCVFEWYNKQGKDESGRIPVIVKPDPEETKRKRTL